MTVESISLLKQVFPGMAADALVQMAWLATMRTYPPGILLCREGANEDVFYIIGEGQVIVTQKMGEEDRFLRYTGPGEYFGEMALIANTPRNASVRTMTETTVLEIDKATFVEMIRQNPIIALTMFRTTVGWLRTNDIASIGALTEQKREIENAYQQLRMQEQRRSEFLTTLAHELRTPLTTANGFIQLLQSGNLVGPGMQMGIDKVASGIEQIVSLVNDLLFVQEMELLEPTVRPVNLPEILSEIVQEVEERAADRSLAITVQLPEKLPELEADIDGLTRAFRALLDNAIKFSLDGGEIRIDVGVSDDHLNIAFADPGIGIAPDFMPRIFDRFERTEKHGDNLFSGMGLGLSIAKHMVESFGGRISVASEVGAGSQFTVHLPVLVATEPADRPALLDDTEDAATSTDAEDVADSAASAEDKLDLPQTGARETV